MKESTAKIAIPHPLFSLGQLFKNNGAELYAVGGFVRNSLLNLPSYDVDITSALSPQVVAKMEGEGLTVEQRAYGLGTFCLRFFYEGKEYLYEYTSFREDNYLRGHKHTPGSITFTTDINADANRRDFTINALYANMQGEVLDITQKGLDDLNNKVLRSVNADTLNSDALRILRLIRFYGELGFKIDKQTLLQARKNASGLKDISKERIIEEFNKILLSDLKYGTVKYGAVKACAVKCEENKCLQTKSPTNPDVEGGSPSPCKNKLLKTLYILNAIEGYKYILPCVEEAKGVAQKTKYHKYDVFNHLLRTCASVEGDLTLRWAALLHDVGKKESIKRDGNMYLHAVYGQSIAKNALYTLKADRELTKNVCTLIAHHMFDLDNNAKEKSVLKVLIELKIPQFKRLIALREGDFAGSGRGEVAKSAKKWDNILTDAIKNNAPIDIKDLAISGADIIKELNIQEGKEVGELLCKLQLIAVKKTTQNVYKNLIKYAKMMYIAN